MKPFSIRGMVWMMAVVSALLLSTASWMVWDLSRQSSDITHLMDDAREVSEETMKLILLSSELEADMSDRLRDQWLQTVERLKIKATDAYVDSHDLSGTIRHFNRTIQGLVERLETQTMPLLTGEGTLSISFRHDLQATLVRIGEAASALSSHAMNRLISVEERLAVMLLVLLTIMFLSSMLLLTLLLSMIERPVNQLVEGVRELEQGNLSVRIKPVRTDEFNRIASAINDSLESLQRLTVSRDDLSQEVELRRDAEARALKALHDLKVAQEQMLHIEKLSAVGTFVGGLAHELNNPIMGVVSYCEFIEQRTKDDPEIQKMVEKAKKQLDRMTNLTQSVLKLSRRPELGSSRCFVAEAVNEVCELMETRAKSESVQIVREPVDDRLQAAVNVEVVVQILTNLISNAIDAVASADTRRVRVSVGAEDDRIILTVSDTGPGVPEDLLHRIFDPFFTTKAQGKGTGLGLGIVARFASDADGLVTCNPNGSDGGAEFTVKLPQVKEAGEKGDTIDFAGDELAENRK